MSYSVYLTTFTDRPIDNPAAVRALLEPLTDAASHNIVVNGLPTEIYGMDEDPLTGLTFSRIKGDAVWQVLYDVAALAGVAVMPQDGPICLTDPAHRDRVLQEAVDEVGVRHIRSGADIARVIAEIGWATRSSRLDRDRDGNRDGRFQDCLALRARSV